MAQRPVEMMIHCTLDFPVGQTFMDHDMPRAFRLELRLARLIQPPLLSGQGPVLQAHSDNTPDSKTGIDRKYVSIFTISLLVPLDRFSEPILCILMFLPARFSRPASTHGHSYRGKYAYITIIN